MHQYTDRPPPEIHFEAAPRDTYLLRQYVQQGSQTAFDQIVRHHGSLVYATCLREVHDAALAEDAAQVVFLLLARKAASLRHLSSLSGWLFRTARFASRNALRHERRRRLREQKAAQDMGRTQHHAPEAAWSRLEPLLNDALDSLAPKEQEVVLMRYFDGLDWRETADTLAISEDAAQKRCARALDKMRRIVSGAGLVLSLATLTDLLSDHAAQAAISPATVAKIAGSPSSHVMKLYQGVTHAMILIKAAAVLGGLFLTGTAGLLWARQTHAPIPPVRLRVASSARPTATTPEEMLIQVQDHYRSLSSFSMQITHRDSSGLYPGVYRQQLQWRRGTPDEGSGGRFVLRNMSLGNKALREDLSPTNDPRAVPDFFADGRQVISVWPSGKKMTDSEAPQPNSVPGWEVTGDLILGLLQDTPNSDLLTPPPGVTRTWSLGRRTIWHGLKVRELRARFIDPAGISLASFFLDATSPILVGEEAPTGWSGRGKIGYSLFTNQKENPLLPATLGDAP